MADPIAGSEVVSAGADELLSSQAEERRLSRRQLILRRFLRNRTAVLGLVVYAILVLAAIFGPYVYPWKFDEIDNTAFLQPPSAQHIFGTTQEGRDVLALTLKGLGKSMLIGVLVAVLSTGFAALVGAFAAYYGKLSDRAITWVIDLMMVIPSFLIIAILTTNLTGSASWLLLIILLAAFSWMLTARVMRSISMSLTNREYVLAAKFMGIPGPVIIVRHILPNAFSYLIVDATLNVASAILSETTLSFFGFGIQPPDTSLGTLIGDFQRMASTFPWTFIPPALILVIMILAVNAVGDGLRDALDPTSGSGGKA
jgi:peptide/nickel transport system permease protein